MPLQIKDCIRLEPKKPYQRKGIHVINNGLFRSSFI